MFSAGLSEEHKNRIELHGVISPAILETLVNFIYSGDISLSEDNVQVRITMNSGTASRAKILKTIGT